MIAHSQEAVDADHVAVHAGAAVSDIFDRSDSLIGIVVDIQANYLRTKFVLGWKAGKYGAGVSSSASCVRIRSLIIRSDGSKFGRRVGTLRKQNQRSNLLPALKPPTKPPSKWPPLPGLFSS